MATLTPTIEKEIGALQAKYRFIGRNEKLRMAILRAKQVAPYNISVLVSGESGTGKETIPRIIHDLSNRSRKPYVAVNCGALPEGIIDSALFGHVKGAFTDAISDHKGYFEEADEGTIFLDELAEMPLATQARLLRVLESGEFRKVGSSKTQTTNVRIIAATNKDLLKAIEMGTFREDLYYRLSAIQIEMPSLRERGEDDIRLLAMHFSREFAIKNNDLQHQNGVRFEPDAIKLLAAQKWPGNVRQFKNTIDYITLCHNEERVTADMIRPYMPMEREAGEGPLPPVLWGEKRYTYDQAIPVMFQIMHQLGEKVARLESYIGEQQASPYVSNSASSLERKATSLTDEPYDSSDPIIERVDYSGQYRGHIVDVSDDVSGVKTLDEIERDTICGALKRNMGKRKPTAEELKISERTLYRKIKQYNIDKNGEVL